MSTTVEVSPTEIKRPVKPGQQLEETLTVRNLSDDRSAYQVRAGEALYRNWVDPDPEHFAIEAHDDRAVVLNLLPPRGAKSGLHQFQVLVVNDDDEADRAAVDVELRVPIPPWLWIVLAGIVVAIILLILWQVGVFS